MVEDPLSEKLLWKEFTAGQMVVVDAENGEIAFRSLDQPTDIDVPPAELAGKE
jgi:ATP-dependent Clp protease ATP-binding subunit ClpC